MTHYFNDPEMDERFILLGVAVFLLILSFCSGCTSTRYVPVEKSVTEVRYRDSIRRDSIYQRDSIYLQVTPDTVYKYKQRTEYRYLFIDRTDTLCLTDTVRIERTVEVERPRKWYDTALLWYGRVAFCALLVIVLFIFLQRKREK